MIGRWKVRLVENHLWGDSVARPTQASSRFEWATDLLKFKMLGNYSLGLLARSPPDLCPYPANFDMGLTKPQLAALCFDCTRPAE